MTRLICALWLALTLGMVAARAEDDPAMAVAGAYLLIQENGAHRVLAFTRDGTVSLVGSGQQRRGYTSGLGNWQQVGSGEVVASIIDFNFDRDSGEPSGTSLKVYTLTFEGLEQGRYERLSGRFSGQQFARGQDPLNPTEPAIRSFGQPFTGRRISAP